AVDEAALRSLVGRHPLDDGQPIYAVDTSVWPRDDAECSPARGYYYSSRRQSAGQPIVTGWSYSWLAQLSFTHDSWPAPLDARRGGRPRQDAEPPAARQRPHQAAAERHADPGRGRAAAAPDAHPQAALALVARPGRARPVRRLAGVRPSLRPGAHLPLLQAV